MVRAQHLFSRLVPPEVTQRYNNAYVLIMQTALLDDGAERGTGLIALLGAATAILPSSFG